MALVARPDLNVLISRMQGGCHTVLHGPEVAFRGRNADDHRAFLERLAHADITLNLDGDPTLDRMACAQKLVDLLVAPGVCRVYASSALFGRAGAQTTSVDHDGVVRVYLADASIGWTLVVAVASELARRGFGAPFHARALVAGAVAFRMILDCVGDLSKLIEAPVNEARQSIGDRQVLLRSVIAETVLLIGSHGEAGDESVRTIARLATLAVPALSRPRALRDAGSSVADEPWLDSDSRTWLQSTWESAGRDREVQHVSSFLSEGLEDPDRYLSWIASEPGLSALAEREGEDAWNEAAHVESTRRSVGAGVRADAELAAAVQEPLQPMESAASFTSSGESGFDAVDIVLREEAERIADASGRYEAAKRSVAVATLRMSRIELLSVRARARLQSAQAVLAELEKDRVDATPALTRKTALALLAGMSAAASRWAAADETLFARHQSAESDRARMLDNPELANYVSILREYEEAERSGVLATLPAVRRALIEAVQPAKDALASLEPQVTPPDVPPVTASIAVAAWGDRRKIRMAAVLPAGESSDALLPGTMSLAAIQSAGTAFGDIADAVGVAPGGIGLTVSRRFGVALLSAEVPADKEVDEGFLTDLLADSLEKTLRGSDVGTLQNVTIEVRGLDGETLMAFTEVLHGTSDPPRSGAAPQP